MPSDQHGAEQSFQWWHNQLYLQLQTFWHELLDITSAWKQIPAKPLTPKFDDKLCTRSYASLFTGTGLIGHDCGNYISHDECRRVHTHQRDCLCRIWHNVIEVDKAHYILFNYLTWIVTSWQLYWSRIIIRPRCFVGFIGSTTYQPFERVNMSSKPHPTDTQDCIGQLSSWKMIWSSFSTVVEEILHPRCNDGARKNDGWAVPSSAEVTDIGVWSVLSILSASLCSGIDMTTLLMAFGADIMLTAMTSWSMILGKIVTTWNI